MASGEQGDRISASQLRQLIQQVEPSALLVEPRILRRVIKQDRRMGGFGLHVPHHRVYTIQRDRLLVIADRPELELAPGDDLPRKVLLLARPTDGDPWEDAPTEDLLRVYWRLLFHGRVHMELEQRRASGRLSDEELLRRKRLIGAVEFAEIRSVLQRDELLLPPADLWETYVEFAATYWELRHFAPDHIPAYFPAIRDRRALEQLLEEDVPHERLYLETQLPGAATSSRGVRQMMQALSAESPPVTGPSDPLQLSPPRFWRLVARAERASRLGNRVKAAVLRTAACRAALPERAAEMRRAARAELERLVSGLARTLQLPPDMEQRWVEALDPFLERAATDRWSTEARLLYDLQKVWIENERTAFRLDWRGWLWSLGRKPLRRPLPLLRSVLITKHLRTAERRLSTLRVDLAARNRLAELLDDAFARTEQQMRSSLRPRILAVFEEVGLKAQNKVEDIARDKVVEELLDRIVERGFVHMGDLRDALAANNIKLADIHALREAVTGDELLRADRRLTRQLEGVYHGGPIYLRLPQSLSALGFGTPGGRFLTQFLVLPFGGAYLALEGVRHVVHAVAHVGADVLSPPAEDVTTGMAQAIVEATWASAFSPERLPLLGATLGVWSQWETYSATHVAGPTLDVRFWLAVFLLGTLILLLIHRPGFRRNFVQALLTVGRWLKFVLIDAPSALIRSPLVQRILQSQAYRVLHSYAVRPAFFAAFLLLPVWSRGQFVDWQTMLNVFLTINLFLHSPLGRYADERLTDILVRAWHELRIRIFAALYQWIMDLFHQVMETIERFLYMIDEWLRFRQGDPRLSLGLKLIVSPIWSVIRYVVRMCVTLLIEPQVNPIKHFPVVTVSHKILLPTIPLVAAQLSVFFGKPMALTVATIIITVLPGVFGFLVWELKGNWRLYAANRPRQLPRSRIGSHGETMVGLLRPGFHSGTIPRTFVRLRRAYRRIDEAGDWKAVNRHQAALRHIEELVRRFFDREFCALLSKGCTGVLAPRTGLIHLATNRVDVELTYPSAPPLWLAVEECGGWLTASVRSAGWLAGLTEADRQTVETALAGAYHMMGVDLVREQVEAQLKLSRDQYEITHEGIVMEPQSGGDRLVVIPLQRTIRRPARRAEDSGYAAPPSVNTVQVVPTFSSTRFQWHDWVQYWEKNDLRPSLCQTAVLDAALTAVGATTNSISHTAQETH